MTPMVDWELVERRRSKGWDWDRIAEDEKVGFQADDSAGDPGRALRALYFQRRSKGKRTSAARTRRSGEPDKAERTWTLERVGAILAPLLAVWFLIALLVPSPVGAFLPALPYLLIAMLFAIGLFAFALLRSAQRWSPSIRNGVVAGVVLGLVVSGTFGVVGVVSGCPTLTTATTGEPGSFQKANNPLWADNGAPVFFFYGSAACPFCSAASWSIVVALQAFGTLSGTHYDRSNPQDSYPRTPEVVFAGAALQSRWVSLHVAESTNDNHLDAPATSGCYESSYVTTYDPNLAFPFLVIGGQYVHVGTLVDPGKLAGLNVTQVQDQINAQSGAAWDAIGPSAYLLEAFLVKVNGGQPTSVATNPSVAPLLAQIH
jgi:uncharacterized protein DUF929